MPTAIQKGDALLHTEPDQTVVSPNGFRETKLFRKKRTTRRRSSAWAFKKVFIVLLALFCASSAFAFDLSWTPGSGGGPVEEFRVYRKKSAETSFALLGKTGATVTTFSDPDRTPGNCYRVTAANFVGESAPLEGCALIPPAVTVIILK